MSSSQPCHRKYTLTTLPLSIQTRILSYLCPQQPFLTRTNRSTSAYCLPFRDPPVTISQDCAETLTAPLPHELLAPSLASPILAAAAANLLSHRVSFLTHRNTAGQLSAWITAFAPYVKAVSTTDPLPEWYVHDIPHHKKPGWISALERQHERSVQLLKALSTDSVRLQVLDLMDVPFLDLSDLEDHLMAGLCRTLESSSATLRELALPVFKTSCICDKALEMSCLTKLHLLTVKLWDLHVVVQDSEPLPPPFLRMIRAVNGHADRSRKLTTLRELRLLNIYSLRYDCITDSDRHSSVFLSIKTLRLVMNSYADVSSDHDLFILLFKNLKRLFWNKNPRPHDVAFRKMSSKVPEVHLCDPRWITNSVQVGSMEHYSDKCLFYGESSSDSKFGSESIRTLFAGGISRLELRKMSISSQRLENLSVHITPDNVRAIRKLVEKCQQMKCLELVIDERKHKPLDAEDWRSISRVVPESHKSMCQLAIQPLYRYGLASAYLEATFSCFEAVTKALGAKARRLAFRAKFETRRGVRLMERVCSILSACIQYTPTLESLELIVGIRKSDARICDRKSEQRMEQRLIQLENQLLREVQSLRILDLGIRPWPPQKLYGDHDIPETDSMCSETESGDS